MSKRDLHRNKHKPDPENNKGENIARYCKKEKLRSDACMWDTEFDRDKCQPYFDAYKSCLKEWRSIYWKRMWAGLEKPANVPPKGVDPMTENYVEKPQTGGSGRQRARFGKGADDTPVSKSPSETPSN